MVQYKATVPLKYVFTTGSSYGWEINLPDCYNGVYKMHKFHFDNLLMTLFRKQVYNYIFND